MGDEAEYLDFAVGEQAAVERRRGAACRQEAAQLRAELGPGRFVLEQDVVGAAKGDELGTRVNDARLRPSSNGTTASSRECSTSVGTVIARARSLTSTAYRTARERAACSPEHDARCSSSNDAVCASEPPGMNSVVNTRRNAGFDLPQPRRVSETSTSLPPRLRCRIAGDPALCVAAVEHQSSHSVRMTNRIGDRHRTAPAGAEQAEPIHAGGIDDSLEVVDPVLQRKARILPVGQAAAALVVPDEGVLLAQEFHQWRQTGDVQSRSRCVIQCPALTTAGPCPLGVREPHAIRRGTEPQFLAHVNMLRARRHARRRNLGSNTDAVGGIEFLSFGAWRWCAR